MATCEDFGTRTYELEREYICREPADKCPRPRDSAGKQVKSSLFGATDPGIMAQLPECVQLAYDNVCARAGAGKKDSKICVSRPMADVIERVNPDLDFQQLADTVKELRS